MTVFLIFKKRANLHELNEFNKATVCCILQYLGKEFVQNENFIEFVLFCKEKIFSIGI